MSKKISITGNSWTSSFLNTPLLVILHRLTSSGSSSRSPSSPLSSSPTTPAFKMFYRDTDRDLITVRSESDFEIMKEDIAAASSGSRSVFKVYLSDPDTFSSPSISTLMSPSGSSNLPPMASPSFLSSSERMQSPPTLPVEPNEPIQWTKGNLLGRGAFGDVYMGLLSTGELIAAKEVTILSTNQEASRCP